MAQRNRSKMDAVTEPKAAKSRGRLSAKTAEPQSTPYLCLYHPSPEEITERCAQIRRNWSATERRRRREYVAPLSSREMPFLRVVYALRGI